ncbi:hypothetical protein HZB60_11120 [candidate division KSB1 bacterium]|nr:hypothetical protein [candidate division KSB1 bacterium]
MLLLLAAGAAMAQFQPRNFAIEGRRTLDDASPAERLLSNVIIDILPLGDFGDLWLGTGNGVTHSFLTLEIPEEPLGRQFRSYSVEQGLGKGGVSGLLVTDSIIFASFAFDTSVGISGAGGGIAYTRDGGTNWTWLPQPRDQLFDVEDNGRDAVLGYWPTATNVDNITYDIAMSDSFVWIVSKGGGLRRHAFAESYTDYNDTTGWQVVSPDTFEFHPGERLNHRAFSCIYAEGALWVGTAAGVNKSTDNGGTWTNFSAGSTGISGNFITALAYQEATHTVWAASWRAEGNSEFYAVSKTTDGGATWTAALTEDQIERAIGRPETPRVHSFAFDTTVVYACDDLGLWKSVDGGANWDLFGAIVEQATGRMFFEAEIYGALKSSGTLWVGGLDGLASSGDEGAHWTLYQTAKPLSEAGRAVDTYAYPNPWSPQRFGPIKFRYTTTGGNVKITIYDFAMSKVVELPTVTRPGGEQYEVWDGTKSGEIVANGTYFYKIDKPGGAVWGKLIVLD